jgi:hypothetical protein
VDVGGKKCGCDVVQRADGYSGKPGLPITFAANAAGSGSENGNRDRVLLTSEVAKTKWKT